MSLSRRLFVETGDKLITTHGAQYCLDGSVDLHLYTGSTSRYLLASALARIFVRPVHLTELRQVMGAGPGHFYFNISAAEFRDITR